MKRENILELYSGEIWCPVCLGEVEGAWWSLSGVASVGISQVCLISTSAVFKSFIRSVLAKSCPGPPDVTVKFVKVKDAEAPVQ